MKDRVELAKVKKHLDRLPKRIYNLFLIWVDLIENDGWEHTKSLKVYRDHALKGVWKGFRSASLKWSYRVIYQHQKDGQINIIKIERISKHEYKR